MLRVMYETLITVEQAQQGLGRADWQFVDCRFDLRDVDAGRAAFQRAHLPGAVYAHLDEDLSGSVRPGETGRHPLPDQDSMTSLIRRWGLDAQTQTVVYDDMGGRIAARLWWMLRYAGLDRVAVLDGGWPAWTGAGLAVEQTQAPITPSDHLPSFREEQVVSTPDVQGWLAAKGAPMLLDARATARYRGEVEPLDPVAGHIPGAVSLPCADSLRGDGTFRARDALREEFSSVMSGQVAEVAPVAYCGSGVTACHLILAMTHVGVATPRLYPGSWSEWCADPSRPVSVGLTTSR